jgi:hypothetical protein
MVTVALVEEAPTVTARSSLAPELLTFRMALPSTTIA